MNWSEIAKALEETAKVIGGIALILTAILTLFGKLGETWNKILKPLWYKILKPSIKLLAFLGTQIIPNGIIVWILLYSAAGNSIRLAEPQVFLSLITQATVAVSLYAIVWGIWLCPWLRPLLVNQKRSAQQSSGSNQLDADKKQESDIESPSEYQ